MTSTSITTPVRGRVHEGNPSGTGWADVPAAIGVAAGDTVTVFAVGETVVETGVRVAVAVDAETVI